MSDVRVIGLDITKSVFQLHGVDDAGAIVLQKRLTRARLLPFFEKLPPCLVGIEACATSHFWARELARLGHEVKLMPAQYVKPYVKRQKNDMADAEAIAEAFTRPSMRFVGPKSPDEQSAMMLHKVRLMLTRQLVMITNATRAHMAEFGLIAPVGRGGVDRLLAIIDDGTDDRISRPSSVMPADAGRAAQARKAADSRQRSSDLGTRPIDRAWPSADGSSRRRPACRFGPGCLCARPINVPLRSQHGSVARPRPEAELFRWEGTAGIDHEGG